MHETRSVAREREIERERDVVCDRALLALAV